jgi:pimeloyl-ACP methyl ester carboxylesterase
VLGPVVLNDIGPVIGREGLARIAGYVGRAPLPSSWPEAVTMVREMHRKSFPDVSDDIWGEVTRAWFNDRNGRPAPGYDAKIANTLSILDGPMPELWPQFDGLKRVPVLVIRGENSDILSADTVAEMRRRHSRLSAVTVPRQGHAPLLKDRLSIDAITAFLIESDRRLAHAHRPSVAMAATEMAHHRMAHTAA